MLAYSKLFSFAPRLARRALHVFPVLAVWTLATVGAQAQRIEGLESRTVAGFSDWRGERRVGLGMNFAGVYGIAGLQAELNLTPKWCVQIGFGDGGDYSSFAFQAKRLLGGSEFSPYVSSGVARWASRDDIGPSRNTLTPAFLSSRFLSESQKEEGSFQEILWAISFGAQYTQSHGPWAGTSIFIELNGLSDVVDMRAAATGTLGLSYFF